MLGVLPLAKLIAPGMLAPAPTVQEPVGMESSTETKSAILGHLFPRRVKRCPAHSTTGSYDVTIAAA